MSPALRYERLLYALRILAHGVAGTVRTHEPAAWQAPALTRTFINGFVHELAVASTLAAEEPPPQPWVRRADRCVDRAARQAAEPLLRLARHMRIYRFAGDKDVVEDRRLAELDLTPDERLDVLGWDILLLSRARGATARDALALAMGGTLGQRKAVRDDLRRRSLRDYGMT